MVLCCSCVKILLDTRLVDVPFVPSEQELLYCRSPRGAIDAKMDVTYGDPGLQSWFFDKPYPNLCLVRAGRSQKRAPKLEVS